MPSFRTQPFCGARARALLAGAAALALVAAVGSGWSGGKAAAAASTSASALMAGDILRGLSALLPAAAPKKLSNDSEPFREARELLPPRFLVYEAKRFVVFSDAVPSWSRRQANLLDRTYSQFTRFTSSLDTEPDPLRYKLVCILFQHYDDYRTFARANDGVTAEWISGYYSPQHDRVVFYNIETNPDLVAATTTIGTEPGAFLAGDSRLGDDYRRAATATVVHEAIHQLAFHTRLQSPHIENPLWLSEGLATSFETDRPDKSFGPDVGYRARQEQFNQILANGTLVPLRDLVTWVQMPDSDDETITAVYHQSYSLVTWMHRFRREDLATFLESLRHEKPGRPTAKRQLELFEQAFGDVDMIERLWLRYEKMR